MASLNFGKKQKKKAIPEKINFTPVLHAKQREMWGDNHRFLCLSCGRRFGKALALDTPILKKGGIWSTVGELQIGDWIYDDRGEPVEVTELHGTYFDRPCYRVHFDNGDSIVADADDKSNKFWASDSSTESLRCLRRWYASPVPAGISLPTITFSLSPRSSSRLAIIAASVNTLVVSWKEAAEINELVDKLALVIPNNINS